MRVQVVQVLIYRFPPWQTLRYKATYYFVKEMFSFFIVSALRICIILGTLFWPNTSLWNILIYTRDFQQIACYISPPLSMKSLGTHFKDWKNTKHILPDSFKYITSFHVLSLIPMSYIFFSAYIIQYRIWPMLVINFSESIFFFS